MKSLVSLGFTVLSCLQAVEGKVKSELVYQYSGPTWIENLAVREDGRILPARATSAVLTELNLRDGAIQTAANESNVGSAIMGITEVVPDLFVMNTMYCDLTQLSCTAGTGITWSIDFRKSGWEPYEHPKEGREQPVVRKLAKGPSPESVLNGMAALNENTALIVDQALGGIWAININHGGAQFVIHDESMVDPEGQANGVNGIRVRPGILYFNNPALGTFARMPINPKTGEKTGEAVVIAKGLEPDDFEIDDRKGVAYLTNGPANTLLEIDLKTGKYKVIVDGLAGPTTARWANGYGYGYESGALYVATTGGYPQWLDNNPTVGGAIYKVTVSEESHPD